MEEAIVTKDWGQKCWIIKPSWLCQQSREIWGPQICGNLDLRFPFGRSVWEPDLPITIWLYSTWMLNSIQLWSTGYHIIRLWSQIPEHLHSSFLLGLPAHLGSLLLSGGIKPENAQTCSKKLIFFWGFLLWITISLSEDILVNRKNLKVLDNFG